MRHFILLTLLFISCNSKTNIVEKYTNGKSKRIIEHVDDNKYYEKEYYQNGKVKCEMYFENGKQEKLEINFRDDGSKIGESEFKNGLRNGIVHEIYKNGQIAFEGRCINGEFEGLSKDYFENGNIKSIRNRHLSKDTGWGYDFNLKGDTIRRTYSMSTLDSTLFFNGKGKKITAEEWENIWE